MQTSERVFFYLFDPFHRRFLLSKRLCRFPERVKRASGCPLSGVTAALPGLLSRYTDSPLNASAVHSQQKSLPVRERDTPRLFQQGERKKKELRGSWKLLLYAQRSSRQSAPDGTPPQMDQKTNSLSFTDKIIYLQNPKRKENVARRIVKMWRHKFKKAFASDRAASLKYVVKNVPNTNFII